MPRLVISLNKIPTSGKILLLCVSQINRLNVYKRSNFTCFITNENFSSLTTISNASFNFWRLQANKLMSTTSQERTPCYLLRSPEGIPKTLVFWLRGYTKTRRYSKPALPKILCHSHILKNLACERLAPSIHQAPRVRLGTQYSVGHLISISHSNEPVSRANHSIWKATQ